MKFISILVLFISSYAGAKDLPCKVFNEKKQLITKTKKVLTQLKSVESNLKDVTWTGQIPDGCYCMDKIGTDGKPLHQKSFKCSVGAGSGIEITYSNDLSISRIQYFEP